MMIDSTTEMWYCFINQTEGGTRMKRGGKKVFDETLLMTELRKHLPELQRRYWEENIEPWEARIEKLPLDHRKDSRMFLLFAPSFPFRGKLWETIVNEHYLSNGELMGVIKYKEETHIY